MKHVRTAIAWLDFLFDGIPSYEDGRWYRCGGWGCRMRMHRLWWNNKDYE